MNYSNYSGSRLKQDSVCKLWLMLEWLSWGFVSNLCDRLTAHVCLVPKSQLLTDYNIITTQMNDGQNYENKTLIFG